MTSGITVTGGPPPQPIVSLDLTLDKPTVLGGESVDGTVTVDTNQMEGFVIVALGTDSQVVSVPNQVIIILREGNSVKFTAHTSPVSDKIQATITTTTPGSAPAVVGLVVLPLLDNVFVNPPRIRRGDSGAGTVSLNAPAPAAGNNVVQLSSNRPDLVTLNPNRLMIPNGATSGNFSVDTGPAPTGSSSGPEFPVVITATMGNAQRTEDIVIFTGPK